MDWRPAGAEPLSLPAAEPHSLAARLSGFILDLGGRAVSRRRRDPASPSAIAEDTQSLTYFAVRCSLAAVDSNKPTTTPISTTVIATTLRPRSRIEASLAICIRRMHAKHALLFRSMMDRLHINRRVDFLRGFTELAADLFGDDVNWSKIVALYAFGARLGQYCVEQDMADLLDTIARSLTQFTTEHLTPFIASQGGWEALCEAFPVEEDVEARLWRTLVQLGLGLGLLALYLVYRK